MLDASAPPEPAPRRPEPAGTGVKSAAAPTTTREPKDPENRAADNTAATPQETTPTGRAEAAAISTAREPDPAASSLPQGEDGADGEDALAAAMPAPDTIPPQPPAATQVALLQAAPGGDAPAATEDTSLAPAATAPTKPASTPTTSEPEEADAPKAAASAGEPQANAAKTNTGQEKAGLRSAALQAAAHAPSDDQADGTAQAKPEAEAAPHAKSEAERAPAQHANAEPHQAAGKPRSDAAQAAAETSHKPAAPVMAAPDADMSALPQTQLHQQTAAADMATAAGNSRAALTMQTAVPVSGIAVEIAAQARAGNHRFDIRLDPAELGRIDVRLDIDADGNVRSRLVIERADTYDLLRRDASTLERALQQAGLKTSDSGLEFTLRDQSTAQQDAREHDARGAERAIIPDADIAPADAASGYARLRGTGGGIDIRI
jgi:chemotaxis protein MotD